MSGFWQTFGLMPIAEHVASVRQCDKALTELAGRYEQLLAERNELAVTADKYEEIRKSLQNGEQRVAKLIEESSYFRTLANNMNVLALHVQQLRGEINHPVIKSKTHTAKQVERTVKELGYKTQAPTRKRAK